MNFYTSFFKVGLFTILSRIIGFMREILIAREIGASALSDAIKIAIKLPSLFRRIFAEGAFNASFIPLFTSLLNKPHEGDQNPAFSFAEQILSWLFICLCLFVVIVEWFMPFFIHMACPGFSPERLNLVVTFTRITFPFILFISLTAFYSGILNSLDKFTAVASSPMVGNVFIVMFVVAFSCWNQKPAFNFTLAILGCGMVQLLWVLIPCMRNGYHLRLKRPKLSPEIKLFFQKVGPAAFGAGVVQINIVIDMMLASHLPEGYISYLDFAERLNQLPLSVIGTAISTVLLPLMSRHIAQGAIAKSVHIQNQSIELAMLLTLPAMTTLLIWAVPIIGMIYQHGKFSYADTQLTASALAAFSLGLPAYICIKIFSTTFFSHKDTQTPVKTAIIAVLLNVLLNLVLMKHFKHVGLAIATAISAWVHASLLGYILYKRSLFVFNQNLQNSLARLILCIAFMIPFLISLRGWLMPFMMMSGILKIGVMMGAVLGVFMVFIILAWLTGALHMGNIRKVQSSS